MVVNNGNNSDDGLKEGCLVRICLKDFMTYKNVTLLSGPNLNLVLGPNGTGKSALVCGIIIGLGGDVSTTGRSGHLGEYIRFGCDQAIIEIELFNAKQNERNYMIKRLINASKHRNGKTEYHSYFKLNERDVTRTEVRAFMKTLNINVDNLCQFLPQERVIEFVNMDQKTLLENTEKAAGDINMFENHKAIIDLRKEIKHLTDSNIQLSNIITTESELQARDEEELKRIQERDKFKDEVMWLNKKKPWLEYEEKRVEYCDSKEQLQTKKKELDEISKNLKPLMIDLEKSKKEFEKFRVNRDRAKDDLRNAAKLIEPIKTSLAECFDKIADSKNSYFEKLDIEKKREKALLNYQNNLLSFEEQYVNITEDTNIDERIKQVMTKISATNSKSADLNEEKMRINSQHENFTIELNNLKATKKRIQDIFERRIEKLKEMNVYARKAYDWLRSNEQRFKARIYPPIMTQINIKKKEWAKYVESAISNNDLISFICEDRDDLKSFTDCIKNDLNIRINVVMAPNEDADDFEPNIPISNLASFGFFAYIKDMFTAPNKVMAYLCKTANLHNIPVGNEKTESNIDKIRDIRRFYTQSNIINVSISRYDNEKVTRNESCPEAKYLNLVIDEKQLRETNKKIESVQQTIDSVKSKLEEIYQKEGVLKAELTELMKQKQELQNKKNEKKRLETKIGEIKSYIERNKCSAIDLNEAKIITNNQLRKFEDNQLRLLHDLCEKITQCVKKNEEKVRTSLCETFAKKKVVIAEKNLNNASSQTQDLKTEIRRLETLNNELKDEAKRLRNKAKQISGFDVNDKLEKEVRDKFDSLPNSVEQIDIQIGTLNLRIESIIDADDTVKATYNRRKKEIEKRQRDLIEKQNALKTKTTKLDGIKDEWMPSLESMIAKINNNFGGFMARLNCAGEVSLYKGSDVEAFDEYGISIKVKFRQTEQLKELTSFHQSGGERSVSTMIYMIALQELTQVPFRVVDEINQGMDESNERSVFDLISETSSRNASQYFLFSPKLLPDLTYTDKMKIHVIFNGPHLDFDWSQFSAHNEECDDCDD